MRNLESFLYPPGSRCLGWFEALFHPDPCWPSKKQTETCFESINRLNRPTEPLQSQIMTTEFVTCFYCVKGCVRIARDDAMQRQSRRSISPAQLKCSISWGYSKTVRPTVNQGILHDRSTALKPGSRPSWRPLRRVRGSPPSRCLLSPVARLDTLLQHTADLSRDTRCAAG